MDKHNKDILKNKKIKNTTNEIINNIQKREDDDMAVLTKPNNKAFSVKSDMEKKFLNHTNHKDLELIQIAASKFDKNIERLNNKK